jgi:hypothetical protein
LQIEHIDVALQAWRARIEVMFGYRQEEDVLNARFGEINDEGCG